LFALRVDEGISIARCFHAVVICLELKGRKTALVLICVFALLQCFLRFAIAGVLLTGGLSDAGKALSGDVNAFIIWMFVVIGAVGVLTTYGLWKGTRWGYVGTIGLSVATIVFDIWGIVAVQPTALMGIVLPVVFIAYLLWNRASFGTGVRSIESAGGVRH
jgi:hypothetical protein